MNFAELDELREALGLPYARVCRRADFSPTSYARWRRWARGDEGGSGPLPRSLQALRDVLRQELVSRRAALERFNGTSHAA